MADESFDVPAILNLRQWPARRTEIAQNPRRATAEAGNFFQHRQRAAINIRLIFLAKPRERVGVKSLLRVRAKFADDHRLVVFDAPAKLINLIRQAVIPADVFVEAAQNR